MNEQSVYIRKVRTFLYLYKSGVSWLAKPWQKLLYSNRGFA